MCRHIVNDYYFFIIFISGYLIALMLMCHPYLEVLYSLSYNVFALPFGSISIIDGVFRGLKIRMTVLYMICIYI